MNFRFFRFLFIVALLQTPLFAQGLPVAKPESVGMSSERLKRIEPLIQKYVDDGKLAGVVSLVARKGKVVHFAKFGKADLETNREMQLDTIFRIYSMSKPITSVAVMMLYEEGRFLLDDPVSKYLPEFKQTQVFADTSNGEVRTKPQKREFTVRQLLSHTAGLTYGFFSNTVVDSLYRENHVLSGEVTLADFTKKLAEIPLLMQPGEAWYYSVATDVLGRFVEAVSGQTFDQFLQERIFEPLQMSDAGFFVPKDKHARLASMYELNKDGKLAVSEMDGKGAAFQSKPTGFSGGGGMVATTSDYLRFSQMLLNGGELDGARILGRKTVELMTMNHLPGKLLNGFSSGRNHAGFGLGFRVVVDPAQTQIVGSNGEYSWSGMANTYFWIDPEEELIGLLMMQFLPFGYYKIRQEFQVLTYQAIVD